MPDGMQPYKLPRVSQRLVIVNDTQCNGIQDGDRDIPEFGMQGERKPDIRNTNKKEIWRAPGGLVWADRAEWRNATFIYLPAKVEVWRDWTKVKNSFNSFQDNTVIRWRFPEGTITADLLIRKDGGEEYPFELRIATKKNGEWDRVAYRPYAEPKDMPVGSTERTLTIFKGLDDVVKEDRAIKVWQIPDGAKPQAPFKPSTLQVGGGFYPANYHGNLVACTSCHNRAGESGNYAGVNAPGNDGVISWHPFTMATVNTDRYPQIDTRWATHR